jgi:pimeloyl-ACP methyl ester carboxylesterase
VHRTWRGYGLLLAECVLRRLARREWRRRSVPPRSLATRTRMRYVSIVVVARDQRTVSSPDGVGIAFDVTGAGEPALVFVHGWAGRRSHWDRQVDAFCGQYLVVRLDLAGHGASGIERDRWTVDSFADDVVAVVDALATKRVVLIGHSLGGSVVVGAAEQLERRVVSVIGIDTWSSIGVRVDASDLGASILLPEMRADFVTASARFVELMCGPIADPALVSRLIEDVAAMRPEVAVSILDEAIRKGPYDLENGLQALTVPKWAISSETFRPKDSETFASFGITNITVPRTGHYLMLERPEEFNRELATAIARSTTT